MRCLNNSYYWEDLDKKCYSCTIINNCVTCKDKTTCLTCKSGYITNNNGTKCVLCDPNCSKCSFNASKGTEGEAVCAQDGCNNGFYYEADKCLSCVENGS